MFLDVLSSGKLYDCLFNFFLVDSEDRPKSDDPKCCFPSFIEFPLLRNGEVAQLLLAIDYIIAQLDGRTAAIFASQHIV